MNQKKYNDTKKVTARRKAKFIRDCKDAKDKNEVLELAKGVVRDVIANGVKLESSPKDLIMAMFACGRAVWELENAQTVEEYVTRYIRHKFVIFDKLNDTGALGDAIEMVIHLLAMRRTWRTQKKNLHVTRIRDTDVKLGGVRFEVGHNAKLWADSTMDDAMAGPFEGVIYGMIDNEEMLAIAEVMEEDFNRGITELADQLYVFADKNQYLEVMQNDLGRSATIKYREDLNQMITVYNGSKQNAWIKRMEGSEFPTLTEYMKKLGQNDYLK
jgi:hypothetical protein